MANAEDGLAIEIAFSPRPRELRRVAVSLTAGATVADALVASAWPEVAAAGAGEAPFAAQGLSVAVWNKACALSTPLADGDRVEVLRALLVSPMEARRARYEKAGGVKALRKRKHAAQLPD